MKSFIIKALIALGLLAAALENMPQANAQTDDSAIVDSLQGEEETPPPAEAPYPGAAEEGFTQENQPAASHEASAAPQGQTIKLETPLDKSADGTYFYGVDESKKTFASSLRGGLFGPPAIQNPRNNAFFKDIYVQQNIPTAFFDFEWELKTFLGDIGAKLGTGVFYVNGTGKFADSSRSHDTPPEQFTFIMFPNTVSAIYRLKLTDKQPLVPYAEAGAGYFTFMELRDDGAAPKFAAAPVTFLAAGGAFLLDWLDPKAIRDLDREYGVNHVYVTAEYREIIGLNKTYDFTSRVISAGLLLEF